MKNQFQTKDQVIEFLSSIEWLSSHSNGKIFSNNNPLFCLRHGEYSRADYLPCHYRDGWAVKAIYYYYPGTVYAPKKGRIDDELFNELFIIN